MRSAGQEEGFNPHFHPQKWRWSMKVSQAVDLFIDYHKKNSQKNTIRGLWIAFGQIQEPFS